LEKIFGIVEETFLCRKKNTETNSDDFKLHTITRYGSKEKNDISDRLAQHMIHRKISLHGKGWWS
jgi:hypothetical protein